MPSGVPIFPDTFRNLKLILMKALPSSSLLNEPPPSSCCGLTDVAAAVGGVGVAVQHFPKPSISVSSSRLKPAHARLNSCSARRLLISLLCCLVLWLLLRLLGVAVVVETLLTVAEILVSLAVLVERDTMAMVWSFTCLLFCFPLVLALV